MRFKLMLNRFNPKYVKIVNTIADQFDPDFYFEVYPDVKASRMDPLEHYICHGWKEGRDPNRDFSTRYYLEMNPDVNDLEINPFYHYIAHGRLEGRRISDSTVKLARASQFKREDDAIDMKRPRSGVIAMVKNEADIIETFVAHLLALFDVVIMIDHGSKDGTLEFLREIEANRNRLVVYRLIEPGYIQATVMNYMIKYCRELEDLDWIFCLDADEFLPFATRDEFHRELNKYRRDPIIHMNWKNIIPVAYWDYEVDIDDDFYIPPTCSEYCKIAFQPKKIGDKPIWIEQGNHSITRWQGGLPLEAQPAFHIWHLPVRSVNQLSLKLMQGVASYLRLGESRNKLDGLHWFRILNAIDRESLSDEHLNKIVHVYGIVDADFAPLSDDQLKDNGYLVDRLRIARNDLGTNFAKSSNIAELIFRVNGHLAALETSEIEGRPITQLEETQDRVLRRSQADRGVLYERLPELKDNDAIFDHEAISDPGILKDLLRPSYWEIENLTPSAWGGHIPFMFSFVTLCQPRMYVELGSHYGASFFAYCQAAKRNRLTTQAVAIDSWEGDEHAGYYDETVFNNFTYILRNYDELARYHRMYFDEALNLFEDGSIDLLHIDGLHTYEAVCHDFATWLPKLSCRGVIFFHDINVYEREFGVWQLWNQVKNTYPAAEFRHSSGLGIAYVGSEGGTKIERLIDILNSDSPFFEIAQQHYESIANKSMEIFQNRFDLRMKNEQAKNIDCLNEKTSKLKQQVSSLKIAREQLRKALKSFVKK